MIPSPLLVVTDRHGLDRPLRDTVRAVLDGGARWIWFRDKDLPPDARHDLAREVLALVREAGGRLTIGGDAGLAAAIGADGVHLGRSSPTHPHPEASASLRHLRMRGRMGEAALVGVSCHSFADMRAARDLGADYVTLSPIFPTPSKPGYGPALGLAALREASTCGIPVIALGGIGPQEARACIAAGAAGIAVMGGLMRSADPAGQTRRLLRALRPAP